VRDFDGLVPGMLSGQRAIHHSLRALESEVAVQFHHGVMRLNGVVAVDLDFVILLTAGHCSEHHKGENQRTAYAHP